jgi:hypothetical protein
MAMTTISNNHCFFWPDGPISLLKAKYDTSKLESAEIPTYRMRINGILTVRPINIPI